jgi:WD40 repeat protein
LADNNDTAANGLEEAGRVLPSSVIRPPFELAFALRQTARETLPARGAGGEATCLALSEDRRLAAIGTNSGEFSLAEVPSDRRQTFSAGAPILALALSRDHSRVFVATQPVAPATRAAVKSISLADGQAQNLGAQWSDLFAFAASPNGRWLVAGGWDGTGGEVRVRRFDAQQDLQEAAPLVIKSRNDHHESAIPIRAFAFSPDGRTLAVGHGNEAHRGSTGMVTFWDLETGNEADARFTGFGNLVQSLAFSPDGATLAAGSLDGTLRLWDVPGQRPIATLRAAWPIQRVAFSRDGRFVATAGTSLSGFERPSELLLWDVSQRCLSACLARYVRGVRGLEFLPDGKTLLVLTEERALRAIRYEEHEVYRRIPAHEGPILAMEFDASGRLVTSGRDRTIRTWNLDKLETLAERAGLEESVAGLALGTDGKSGITFGDSPEIAWRDLTSGAVLRRETLANELTCVTQAANGAVAAADAQGGLRRWDASGQRTLAWTTPWRPVRQLLFTDEFGRMAVSGCADKVVFWDTQWGNYQHLLEAGSEVCSLALSPDHKLVAAGTARGAIRVWSVERGELVAVVREHTQPVVALAFSADGHTLASAAGSEAVRLWSVPNLERLLSLQGPNEGVRLLRFSPDNQTLVAGLADGSLIIWRAESPKP